MTGWDEDSHPRDEKGRFSGEGGGGPGDLKTWAKSGGASARSSGAGGLREWAKANAPRGPNIAMQKFAGSRRIWTDKQIAGSGKETWQDHYDKHPDAGGKPNAERAEMHEKEIIAPAFAGKKSARELGEKPVAHLTMGGAASGKGVVLKQIAKERDLSNFVHIDPDEVKQKLPEYKASVPKDPSAGATYKGAAAQVHEESSAVAKQIRQRAIEGGHHVIIDGTGADADKYTALVKHLEDKGYEVHVHFPQLHVDEGIKRMNARAEGSGRAVPESVVRKQYASIANALPKIQAAAPTFHTYDAGTKGHPKVSTHIRGSLQ